MFKRAYKISPSAHKSNYIKHAAVDLENNSAFWCYGHKDNSREPHYIYLLEHEGRCYPFLSSGTFKTDLRIGHWVVGEISFFCQTKDYLMSKTNFKEIDLVGINSFCYEYESIEHYQKIISIIQKAVQVLYSGPSSPYLLSAPCFLYDIFFPEIPLNLAIKAESPPIEEQRPKDLSFQALYNIASLMHGHQLLKNLGYSTSKPPFKVSEKDLNELKKKKSAHAIQLAKTYIEESIPYMPFEEVKDYFSRANKNNELLEFEEITSYLLVLNNDKARMGPYKKIGIIHSGILFSEDFLSLLEKIYKHKYANVFKSFGEMLARLLLELEKEGLFYAISEQHQ